MKLIFGEGSPNRGACWMTALNWHTGNAAWTDKAPLACVDEGVRTLCIRLNDMCADGAERERLIGPHLFAPLGTRTEDAAVLRQRAYLCADYAVRRFAAAALRAVFLPREAKQLEALPAVVDSVTATRARAAAHAAADHAAAARAAAAHAAAAAAAAAAALDRLGAHAAADHAAAAARAAAAHADDVAAVRGINENLRELILKLCALGERSEVAATHTREQTLAMLECARPADYWEEETP